MIAELDKKIEISGVINSEETISGSLNEQTIVSGSITIPKYVIPSNYGKITWNGSVLTVS